MAKNNYRYKNIRILSLGTCHDPFVKYAPEAFSEDTKAINYGAMSQQMMAYTTDYFVQYNNFYNQVWDFTTKKYVWEFSKDFLRVNGVLDGAGVAGHRADKEHVAVLNKAGNDLWTNNQKNINAMLEKIIHEKACYDPTVWVLKVKTLELYGGKLASFNTKVTAANTPEKYAKLQKDTLCPLLDTYIKLDDKTELLDAVEKLKAAAS